MRAKHTTRFDDHTYAVSGISADLEQQRRERAWNQRLPTRTDWWVFAWYTALIIVGATIAYAALGMIEEGIFR